MVIDISCHAWLVLKASVVDNPYEHDAPHPPKKKRIRVNNKHFQRTVTVCIYIYMILWRYVNFLPTISLRSKIPNAWNPRGICLVHGATFRAICLMPIQFVVFEEDTNLANPVEFWMDELMNHQDQMNHQIPAKTLYLSTPPNTWRIMPWRT